MASPADWRTVDKKDERKKDGWTESEPMRDEGNVPCCLREVRAGCQWHNTITDMLECTMYATNPQEYANTLSQMALFWGVCLMFLGVFVFLRPLNRENVFSSDRRRDVFGFIRNFCTDKTKSGERFSRRPKNKWFICIVDSGFRNISDPFLSPSSPRLHALISLELSLV